MPALVSAPEPAIALALGALDTAEPPRWLIVARQYPVLWMVVAPVVLALLFISAALIAAPAPSPIAAASPVSSATPPAAPAADSPAAAPGAPRAGEHAPSGPDLAALEGKAPATLSVAELLLLDEGRVLRERQVARALALKLREQPALGKHASVQAELRRLAADPDSASDALAAIALAAPPVGADLLFELSTSKSVSLDTNQLASQLLRSVDVRPTASPALGVALDLRAAASCEAVAAVLPQAVAHADRRSVSTLAKLSNRHGCGATKVDDCYPCLRERSKELLAAQKAARGRRAPSYPAR